MTEPRKDDLTPAGKAPAEGPRDASEPAPSVAPEESHLGPAGDPAEGSA